jgi:DNA mismatch endonuclease (patch repair protein)
VSSVKRRPAYGGWWRGYTVPVDRLTAAARSANMRRIKSRDTSPELVVRRFLHRSGFRFALHRRDLPGRPDIVFPALRTCVFVHGCFWHGCGRCVDGTRTVKSRSNYWLAKIRGNRKRDLQHVKALSQLGWKVYVLWECQLRTPVTLTRLAKSLARRRDNQDGTSRSRVPTPSELAKLAKLRHQRRQPRLEAGEPAGLDVLPEALGRTAALGAVRSERPQRVHMDD